MPGRQGIDNSEHDFLSYCDRVRDNENCHSLYVGYSSDLDCDSVLQDIANASTYLQNKRKLALATYNTINDDAKTLQTSAISYIFSDNDIVLITELKNDDAREKFVDLRSKTSSLVANHIPVDSMSMHGNLSKLRKLAEQKIDSAKQMRAVYAVADSHSKRETLKIRRQARTLPLVMLVEDDRFTATYTAQLLAKDYDVFHVRSGEEAIEYYLDYAPDAVFIDLHLPGMSGNQVLQMIRAIDPEAYCIMLSVDTTQSTVQQAVDTGAQSFLRKPYNKERLLWTVRQSPHMRGLPAGRSTSSTFL